VRGQGEEREAWQPWEEVAVWEEEQKRQAQGQGEERGAWREEEQKQKE
jgi:hypothetical protein